MTYQTNLEQERRMLFCLNQIQQLGAVSICSLGEYFGSYSNLFNIEETALRESGILREAQIQAFCEGKKRWSEYLEEYEKLAERKIRFVTPLDPEYPERLLHIHGYPMALYVRGKLPDPKRPAVAVVGARGCSEYGSQLASAFAEMLAKEQVQIISGLALGIDGAAHQGALKAEADTYGILGCGVNICYPRSNYSLYTQIGEQGGLISEYPPDTPPLARNFPMRNRIISGLSDAVLVIEARKKSGSLITAQTGLDQGKDIYAVPGRITDSLSEGCNQLIASGAFVLLSAENLLESMGISYKKKDRAGEKIEKGLAKREKMVYSCLDSEPRHIEEIASKTGLSVSQSMDALLELELGGYAVRTAGLYYTKKLF